MTNGFNTVVSPKVAEGTVSWYEGDTFTLTLTLCLSSLGEAVTDLTGFTLGARIRDAGGAVVHTFTQAGNSACTFALAFTSAVSEKLYRGNYTLDVYVTDAGGDRSTVAADVPVTVR